MPIKYIKGDLFNIAPKGVYLAHAVNPYGVWGAGIAAIFARKYPDDHQEYNQHCKAKKQVNLPGTTYITENNIACLFTLSDWGDNPSEIIFNTGNCLLDLFEQLPLNSVVYSPKFNSGLFNVPWEYTAEVLEKHLATRNDIHWVVCEL